MRFCPFCSAESPDVATQCHACARRLPPLPPRRSAASEAAAIESMVRASTAPEPEPESALEREPRAIVEPEPKSRRTSDKSTPDDNHERPAPVRPRPTSDQDNDWSGDDHEHRAPSDSDIHTDSWEDGWDEARAASRVEPRRNVIHEPAQVTLPDVGPLPTVPGPGVLEAVKYTIAVVRARWQRRSATKDLEAQNRRAKVDLDETLAALGKQTRVLGIRDPALETENQAIDRAEERRAEIERACDELSNQQAREDNAFAELEAEQRERLAKLEAERSALQREIDDLEARRRGAREKLETIERQQRGYLDAAEKRDEQAGRAPLGDARSGLRHAAEDLRRDAQALDSEKQALEQRLAELEQPKSLAMASKEALDAQIDDVKRHINDARESHRHRLAELETEQNQRTRELSQADSDIARHLISLGTLVNLHRIEHDELHALYTRIDELRSAMGARSTAIDRLAAESEAYERESYKRGLVAMAGAALALLFLIMLLFVAC